MSIEAWNNYIQRLRQLDETAASEMREYLQAHPIISPETRRSAIDYAYALATKYGEGSAALSCLMYDAVAGVSTIGIPEAEPAPTATYEEVARAINGTLKFSENDEVLSATVGRLTRQVGADTTLHNAIRDQAEFAWIPQGAETCAFCITLASNGWQEASRKVLRGNHAEHIHPHCDCMFAIRFTRDTVYAGYNPDKYLRIYEEAEGRTWKDKVNSIRRDLYAASLYGDDEE